MTIRKQIIELLADGLWTARDISKALHISEKDAYDHLEHVSRTMKKSFGMQPAECLACGFKFIERRHVRCPSRCPKCKNEHIQEPVFYAKP